MCVLRQADYSIGISISISDQHQHQHRVTHASSSNLVLKREVPAFS